MFLKMEDDLNHFKVRLGKTTSTISEQTKTNKNKNNGCGTAPGNLVFRYFQTEEKLQKLGFIHVCRQSESLPV